LRVTADNLSNLRLALMMPLLPNLAGLLQCFGVALCRSPLAAMLLVAYCRRKWHSALDWATYHRSEPLVVGFDGRDRVNSGPRIGAARLLIF
jgi:hypothetical protein